MQALKRANELTMPNDWSRFNPGAMEQIRDYVEDQVKAVGATIVTSSGTRATAELIIPQQGKFLMGIGWVGTVAAPVPQGPFNLILNNEKILESVDARFYDVALITNVYYPIPRPLTGVDKLIIEVTDTVGASRLFCAWYV